MKKSIVLLMLFVVTGCYEFNSGPSEGEVFTAIEAAIQGLCLSLETKPQTKEIFINTAHVILSLQNGALINDINFTMKDDGSIDMKGNMCLFKILG